MTKLQVVGSGGPDNDPRTHRVIDSQRPDAGDSTCYTRPAKHGTITNNRVAFCLRIASVLPLKQCLTSTSKDWGQMMCPHNCGKPV